MAALVAVIAVTAGLTAYCLADLALARDVRTLSRGVWAVICLASMPLGGILYLVAGKARKPRDLPGPARRWPMWRAR